MSLPRYRRFRIRGACLLVVCAIPWALGAPGDGEPEAAGGQVSGNPARAALPDDVASALAALDAAESPEERRRVAIYLARTLPVSEFAAWHRNGWFPDEDPIEVRLFDRITRRRWIESDPDGMMGCWLEHKLKDMREVFGDWVDHNPPLALEWVESLPKADERFIFGDRLGFRTVEVDPLLALELLPRIEAITHPRARGGLSMRLDRIAENHSEALRKAAVGWPPELAARADKAVARASLERDFAAAVAELRGRPDGKELFVESVTKDAFEKHGLEGVAELPAEWLSAALTSRGLRSFGFVSSNPDLWLDADLGALGLGDELVARVRKEAIIGIARKDPAAALDRAERDKVEVDRKEILQRGLKMWAMGHPDEARDFVASLTDPEEKALAERLLDGGAARPKPVVKPPPAPEKWLAGLADLDESAVRKTLYDLRKWDAEVIQAACGAFAAMPEGDKLRTAVLLAEHAGESFELRSAALSYLLEDLREVPVADAAGPGRNRICPELNWSIDTAAKWAEENPLAAGRWLRSLPEGDERLWTTVNFVFAWAEFEPAEAREWARALPADERAAVEKHLPACAADR